MSYKVNLQEVEDLCRIAIDKLRANNGCDITFDHLNSQQDPLSVDSIVFLTVKYHGETYMKFAFQGGLFLDDFPRNLEEEQVKHKRGLFVLRIAKQLYDAYNSWKEQQGLRVTGAPFKADLNINNTTAVTVDVLAETQKEVNILKQRLDRTEAESSLYRQELEDLKKLFWDKLSS